LYDIHVCQERKGGLLMRTFISTVLILLCCTSILLARSQDSKKVVSDFTITLATPPAPVITGTTPTSPSNNASPTVHGTTVPGATVKIYRSATCTGTFVSTIADGLGNFSAVLTVTPNTAIAISASANDGLGDSPCSGIIVYQHDNIAPATPVLTGTVPSSPSSNAAPTIKGTAEPNSLIKLYFNGTCAGSPTANGVTNGSGIFSIPVTVPANAITTITAIATDAAGNSSSCSTPMTYTHDDLPPSVPAFTGTSPSSPANNNHPHILGTAEAGSLVSIYTDDACTDPPTATGIADIAGTFDIQVDVANNSTTTFYAHAADVADNVSTCTPSGIIFVEDSNLPTGSICGTKYHDVNGNGIYEPGLGETPLSGWTIVAVSSEGDTLTTVTDIDGKYCFIDVTDTVYKVFEELQSGYIQSGGEPYFTLVMPGELVDSIDFGNFKSGEIYGIKYNDLDGNGSNDGEPGIGDWTIYLAPKNIPNPTIDFSHATASFNIQLDAVPSAPVTGILAGNFGDRRGTFDVQSNQIPTELLSLNLQSTAPVVIGGDQGSIGVVLSPGRQFGGVQGDGSSPVNSFFDVFLEFELVSVGPGGGCYVGHSPLHLSGVTNGVPFPQGTQWAGGNIQLFDKTTGQPVGTLDEFRLTVGAPVSITNPIYTKTDSTGKYCFMPLLPGPYNVREVQQPCWEQTTSDPSPITILSGDSLTNVDFGNRQRETQICVLKIYDANHNQIPDAGEPPMEGVEFVLTGLQPSNVFSAFTDVTGRACFNNIPSDDYVLTENVTSGYAVSVPKSGFMAFQISGCHDTSVTWLNTAAFTDSLFRTATVEQWAMAVDQKGKRKSIKCKPDKVDFKFNLAWKLDHLKLKFPMFTRGEVRVGKDKQQLPIRTWDSLKVVELDLPGLDTSQTIQIDGRGFKGKLISVSYEWSSGGIVVAKGKLPGDKTVDRRDSLKANSLRLPMPNLHNVGEDIQLQGAFPLTIGAPSGIGSVIHFKYKDVQKSLVKDDHGIPTFHRDSVHCLESVKGKPVTKQLKAYPPDIFGGNRLFAEVLALKLNIFASQRGKFPPGLDTLIYDYSGIEPGHPLNGKSIGEICRQADIILGCGLDPKGYGLSPIDYYIVVHRINSAFGSSVVDTISWSCSKLVLKGVKSLKDVPWLYANPGAVHNVTVPLLSTEPEPSSFFLSQNFPNPFNPTTTIKFELLEPALVTLKIYNTLGQEVASLLDEELLYDGSEEVEFDASKLPSGVYFYRIIAQGIGDEEEGIIGKRHVEVKKMLLVK